MKCHYEVLDISRDAEDGEIKSAYRKLALKWHPDKNLENTEYAKEQFQFVQQAYDVLSDRQERAWYDNHREQILRGSNSDYKDNNLDVFQYFTTTCFKGYGDDEVGFYCTYGAVFEQIAKEDAEYMDGKNEVFNVPTFGNSQSAYDEVVGPFYDYWMSYSTKKSYVWLDPHDIKEALNRKIFKLIEKENDKIRQKAKKERNEEVRSLAAFVRKRDKRVQIHIKSLETKKIENREKQKKLSEQKRLERIKQLNESSEQADWMKFENVQTELEEVEKKLAEQFGDQSSDSDENSEDEGNNLYCIACNKIFKTPKAFKNHESSKKHRENVENLREILNEDDLLVENNLSDSEIDINAVEQENGLNNSLDLNSEEDLNLEDEEDINIIKGKTKKKKKKSKNIIKVAEHNSDVEINNDILDNITKESEECALDVNSEEDLNIEDEEDFNIVKGKTKKKKKKSKNIIKVAEHNSDVEINNDTLDNMKESEEFSTKKKQKKKKQTQKYSNKELKYGEIDSIDIKSNAEEGGVKNQLAPEIDNEKSCAKCKAQFSSKNKLFEHLKKTGHSCYIDQSDIERPRKKGVKQK